MHVWPLCYFQYTWEILPSPQQNRELCPLPPLFSLCILASSLPPQPSSQVPVEVYAQYCHKRVEKMTQTGAKKGVKKPTIEEVNHAKVRTTWHLPTYDTIVILHRLGWRYHMMMPKVLSPGTHYTCTNTHGPIQCLAVYTVVTTTLVMAVNKWHCTCYLEL